MRVLLVDDNEELCDFLASALEENAVEVAKAGTPEEALRLIADNSYDAFVVDGTLGDTDGVALIEQLRANRNGKGVPALLMSVIDTSLARRLAQNAGCQFLAKPFGYTPFVEQVRGLR